jgi:hypothetical protein
VAAALCTIVIDPAAQPTEHPLPSEERAG